MSALCQRCRQALSPDSGYCVACGLQNDTDDVYGRMVAGETQMQQRKERAGFWSRVLGFFYIFRRL